MTERERRSRIEQMLRDIAHFEGRLDDLRREVAIGTATPQPEIIRQLDPLRGELNRLMGRVEALRRASEGAWPAAWAQAQAALTSLRDGLDRLEAGRRARAA